MLSADEANRRYFGEAYRTGEHGWSVDKPSPYAVDFLQELSRRVPGGRLLDIGCGEGRHSFAAARLGFQVTGLDYQFPALKRALGFTGPKDMVKVNFLNADLFSLPFPDFSFDIVLDYGCLHHHKKAKWPAYKSSILKILKPQGFYVLSVFSPKFLLFHSNPRKWHIAFGAYRRYFTEEDILRLFGQNFEFEKMAEEQEEGSGFWHILMKYKAES